MHGDRPRVAAALLCGLLVIGVTACDDDEAQRSDSDLALAAAVRVEAEGCHDRPTVGGGSFVADRRVITVAHVVAGSSEVDVVLPTGEEFEAAVVAIDRAKDLAVLAVDVPTSPLPLSNMRAGTHGALVTWRNGGPVPVPFVAERFVSISASDIDNVDTSLRRGYEVHASVEPGDSGSVLVADGAAVAVLFARSTGHRDRAYATDITEADELLAGAGDVAVDVGACASG